jgi:hypothetical protein
MSCAFSASVNPPAALARSPRRQLVISCSWLAFLIFVLCESKLLNGRMRTPGQGLLAIGSPPLIQQRVQVKTGAFMSNVSPVVFVLP